jgi:hypothetical protein
VAARAALGPYDHDHSAIEEAGADPANLAIIKPLVDHRHRVAGKRFLGVNREIQTPMCEGRRSFSGLDLSNYIIRPPSSIM